MAKPTAMSLPDNTTTSEKLTVDRNLSEATMTLATGMIKPLEPF